MGGRSTCQPGSWSLSALPCPAYPCKQPLPQLSPPSAPHPPPRGWVLGGCGPGWSTVKVVPRLATHPSCQGSVQGCSSVRLCLRVLGKEGALPRKPPEGL